MDLDVCDLDRTKRASTVRGHAGDFLEQWDSGWIALSEDGNAAAEMFAVRSVLSDEKLRAVGIRSGVSVSKTSGAVESHSRRSLIFEFVAWIASAGARRVSTLNHEFGDHAMKYCAVIKWNAVFLSVRNRVGPVLGAVRQTNEILHSDRSDLRKQRAMEAAGRGVDDGGGLGSSGRGFILLRS